jgi:TfoX/Sxy family transcriptional regulator of competence genes
MLHPTMAYDEDLARRLRALLADEDEVTEKRMFGGLAFLMNGNMCVSASRNGGLLVRIDPGDTDAALARPHAALMEMGGRTMAGWIIVAPEGVKADRELSTWVRRGVAFAKTLPPKYPDFGAGTGLHPAPHSMTVVDFTSARLGTASGSAVADIDLHFASGHGAYALNQ